MSTTNHSSQTRPGVRFTLRKRAIRKKRDDVSITSYNSDFLNGLFADVAKISVAPDDQESCSKRNAAHMTSDHAMHPSLVAPDSPNKKRCTTLNRSLSRSRCSMSNLCDLSDVQSPKGITDFCRPSDEGSSTTEAEKQEPIHLSIKDAMKSGKGLIDCTHHDSLAFQLDCVSGEDENSSSADSAAIVAFPNLPATVSDSSCSAGLTRANLIKQASSTEKQYKESFGWFVDLDDHQTVETRAGLPYTVSNENLAFQASTAPKGDSNDAEVQWAKAADTVDDVLGDFF